MQANQTQTPPQSPPPDKIEDKEKNLYNSSYGSVFARNFVAGAARSLGGIILYLIFLFVITRIFIAFVLPQLQPFIGAFETLGNINNLAQPGTTAPPSQIQNLLQQFQQR